MRVCLIGLVAMGRMGGLGSIEARLSIDMQERRREMCAMIPLMQDRSSHSPGASKFYPLAEISKGISRSTGPSANILPVLPTSRLYPLLTPCECMTAPKGRLCGPLHYKRALTAGLGRFITGRGRLDRMGHLAKRVCVPAHVLLQP